MLKVNEIKTNDTLKLTYVVEQTNEWMNEWMNQKRLHVTGRLTATDMGGRQKNNLSIMENNEEQALKEKERMNGS